MTAPEDATEPQVVRAVEALLFLSPEPLTFERLCELTGDAPGPVQRALAALTARHGPECALEVAEVGGGWALRTRPDVAGVADRLRGRPPEERLSPAALETLAVVAYLEPVTRREIARLRGVRPTPPSARCSSAGSSRRSRPVPAARGRRRGTGPRRSSSAGSGSPTVRPSRRSSGSS